MGERPILFTDKMVRAILAGRKTQTRRIIKPQPTFDPEGATFKTPGGKTIRTGLFRWRNEWWWHDPPPSMLAQCPYGQPGDLLWVRETWGWFNNQCAWGDPRGVSYKADSPGGYAPKYQMWRPSIHMPRWASRISLSVISVRVERVQEISRADCEAEGVTLDGAGWVTNFALLWDAINAGRGYSWASNPWVWVIQFEVCDPHNAADHE